MERFPQKMHQQVCATCRHGRLQKLVPHDPRNLERRCDLCSTIHPFGKNAGDEFMRTFSPTEQAIRSDLLLLAKRRSPHLPHNWTANKTQEMHLKLFPRRSDFRLIPYLIADIDGDGVIRDFPPVIIFGEPEIFNLWMHTCQFTDIYLSGVFSWGEDLSEVTEELASVTVKEGLEMITDGLP
jgi:hypothetical protein